MTRRDVRRQINCRVSPELYDRIEWRAKERGYDSPVSYVIRLIEADLKSEYGLVDVAPNNDLSRLEAQLDEFMHYIRLVVATDRQTSRLADRLTQESED